MRILAKTTALLAMCCLSVSLEAKPLLTQDFATSTSLSGYTASAPGISKFNDISAKAQGGSWSVTGGQLKLVRTGASGNSNGAGLTRTTSLAPHSSFLCVSFDLGVTLNSWQSQALIMNFGKIPTQLDYNHWGYDAEVFARMSVDMSGNSTFKFNINSVKTTAFPANGNVHRVALYLNRSGASQTYRAPDGALRTLSHGRGTLCVNGALQLDNVVCMNGIYSDLSNLRFRFCTAENGTWMFDNFMITDAALPKVYGWQAEPLVAAKANVNAPELQAALNQLVTEANAELIRTPASVLDSDPLVSANDNDYFSIGPYRWPDASKPNGLPWHKPLPERTNPQAVEGTDTLAFSATCNAIWTLGLAYYLTGNEAYAQKAQQVTRIWFLNTDSAMTPHFNFAQGVPGGVPGRSAGIIEGSSLIRVTDGLALLAKSPNWTQTDETQMRAWFTSYLNWLRTSTFGQEARNYTNNHGTWYDAQVTQYALMLGQYDVLREAATRSITRLPVQMDGTGSQPFEIVRPASLPYCAYNLRGFYTLAQQAEHCDVNWWSYTAPNGASLRKGLDFIAPYAHPSTSWINGTASVWGDRYAIRELLGLVSPFYNDATFQGYLAPIDQGTFLSERWQLLRE